MKITLATAFFLCAFVAFARANSFSGLGYDTQGLEDELNELEALENQDPPMGPPKPHVSLEYAMEAFLKCFMDKNKGKMDKKCIQKLKELLPEDAGIPRMTLIRCVDRSFKKCFKKPKHHETQDCLIHFNNCIENAKEGSGSS